MSHQFLPSIHGRSSTSLPRNHSTSPHPLATNWRAQQSLFMGSNNVSFHQRQVSFSPINHQQDTSTRVQSPHPSSSFHTPTPDQGRVLYASNNYQYGNPCYYYDPSNYPTSVGSQTNVHVFPTEMHRTVFSTPTSPPGFDHVQDFTQHTSSTSATTTPFFTTPFPENNNF
jgi:hypothetical protein